MLFLTLRRAFGLRQSILTSASFVCTSSNFLAMNNKKTAEVDKNKLDVTAIFLIWMTLAGDSNKTALALDIDPKVVEELSQTEDWKEKLRRMSLVSKSDEPGGWERMCNRALNFAQAHRMRELIDRMLLHFADKTPQELADSFSSSLKGGEVRISGRFLADLASASEKVQTLSYFALGDTVPERKERGSEDGETSAAVLHASIIAALNSPLSQGVPASDLVRKAAQAIVESERVPERKPIELGEFRDIE